MDGFTSAVKAICAASAAVCLIEYITSGSRLKRQVKMLLDLIMAVVVLTPFVSGSAGFELPELSELEPPHLEAAAELYNEELCRQTADNIGAVLHEQIKAAGINCENIDIEINISPGGSISIIRVTVMADNFADAAEIIRNSLGNDTEVADGNS